MQKSHPHQLYLLILCYNACMEILWAPWRMAYIAPKTEQKGCIFCTQPAAQRDEEYHILYRGERCFIMLNLYPYNNGHLMIAPYQHVETIEKLDTATLAELMSQAQLALKALRLAMTPDGFNMGINEGKVAGAGFDEHMHLHIVPRWNGDTNFMPVIADVKVMPEHLDTVYEKLKQAIHTILENQE
jgi:ATP adenylyltransferase